VRRQEEVGGGGDGCWKGVCGGEKGGYEPADGRIQGLTGPCIDLQCAQHTPEALTPHK
jgi:hypothetical protein